MSENSLKEVNNNPTIKNEISPQELRDRVTQSLRLTDDPELLLQDAKKKKVHEKDYDPMNDDSDLSVKLLTTFSFDNDTSLVNAVTPKYRGLSIELRRQLIKDFDCKTHAEKVLVDAIVGGYLRQLHCTQSFNHCLAQGSAVSELNSFMSVMSKEIDRANRHMMTAYQMLTNLKKPPIKIQVRAQQAFVAQAQQFNTEKQGKSK